MNIDLIPTLITSISVIYILSIIFCFINYKLKNSFYVFILFTLCYLGTLSFLTLNNKTINPFMEIIYFLSRNNFTFFFWIITLSLLNNNFKFSKLYRIILFFKLLFSTFVILDKNFSNLIIEPTLENTDLIKITFGFLANYIFIILSVIEIIKQLRVEYSNSRSKKIKLIWLLSSDLLFMNVIFLFLILNLFSDNHFIWFSRSILPIIGITTMTLSFLFMLRIEKSLFNETDYLMKVNNNDIQKYKSMLLDLVKEKKIHQNPKITANQVATLLKIDHLLLRNIISIELGYKNFSEFINQFRIEEVFAILQKNKKLTRGNLERIALKSGFNSYMSFYRSFKNKTNTSPTMFKNIDLNYKFNQKE